MTRRRPPYPEPRWQTPLPRGVVGTWGPEVRAWARRELGLALDRWQVRALNRALAVGADGRLVHRDYLVSTGRQNGKTAAVRALIGWALTAPATPDWALILGLAHDSQQARIPYLAVRADLAPMAARERRGALRLRLMGGIETRLGGRTRDYRTGSREARHAVRGWSVDLAVFDEVRTQRDHETVAALAPTLIARPDPLLFAISSAGDDRSIVLRALFELGRRIVGGEEPPGRFGMTWYAPPDDAADDDEPAWALANPAMADGRLTADAIRAGRAQLPPALFRREHLNLWTDSADEWLPPGAWARTVGERPPERPRAVLAVEVAPTWAHGTVAVAVPTDAGAWVAVAKELVPATGALAPSTLVAALGELVAAWRPESVAYSSQAAAAPHVAAWAATADVRTVALHGGQLRAASELFRAGFLAGRLTHADDPLLATQARAARPSGPIAAGSWYFSWRASTGDVDALRAAAWAAWALLGPDAVNTVPQVFV